MSLSIFCLFTKQNRGDKDISPCVPPFVFYILSLSHICMSLSVIGWALYKVKGLLFIFFQHLESSRFKFLCYHLHKSKSICLLWKITPFHLCFLPLTSFYSKWTQIFVGLRNAAHASWQQITFHRVSDFLSWLTKDNWQTIGQKSFELSVQAHHIGDKQVLII